MIFETEIMHYNGISLLPEIYYCIWEENFNMELPDNARNQIVLIYFTGSFYFKYVILGILILSLISSNIFTY